MLIEYDQDAEWLRLPETATPYVSFAEANSRLSSTSKLAETVAPTVESADTVRVIVPGPATNELETLVGSHAVAAEVAVALSTVPAPVPHAPSGLAACARELVCANAGRAVPRTRAAQDAAVLAIFAALCINISSDCFGDYQRHVLMAGRFTVCLKLAA
jgi:hypothetical protein